ncbi:MAG: VanZ family protein [Frankiaceae bacterium]|nr:VanZ family protein [Frankiaceae bacterium]
MRRRLLVLVAAGALGGILALTVGPVSQTRALSEFLDILRAVSAPLGLPEPTERAAEGLANVLLFVPLGAAGGWLARRGRQWWVVLALGVLAVLVEAVQYPVDGRDASLQDVVLNTIGGLLGVTAAVLSKWWWRRRRVGATASASA